MGDIHELAAQLRSENAALRNRVADLEAQLAFERADHEVNGRIAQHFLQAAMNGRD